MNVDIIVGRNLSRLRKRKGLSQDELAIKIGTQRPKISAYENGAGISTGSFERICIALDAEPWEFYITEDTPIIKSDQEKRHLQKMRLLDDLNILEDIDGYLDYRIEAQIKKGRGDEKEGNKAFGPARGSKKKKAG